MPKSGERRSELVAAAETIENDVRRLEELSLSARKTRLNSEKNISRAARELQDALDQQERLAHGLRSLGEAMLRLQQRQQAAFEPLGARAMELQERTARLAEHMERFGVLGVEAGEVIKVLQRRGGEGEASDEAEPVSIDASAIVEVDGKLIGLVEQAKTLADSAQHEDFTDIAREADVLKQRVQSMRQRLAEIVRASAAGNG